MKLVSMLAAIKDLHFPSKIWILWFKHIETSKIPLWLYMT